MIKVVCYTYLAATTIFLNVIERKYKRQIFPPDPIILGLSANLARCLTALVPFESPNSDSNFANVRLELSGQPS